MASLGKIIKDDRHPTWLMDSVILSAVVYSPKPADELKLMEREYKLPSSAKYEFISDEELRKHGFGHCKQTLLVVRSLAENHYVVACRGTSDVSDALVDLNFMQRSMALLPGAAHAGFLDRANSIPLEYFRRLLIRGERLVITGHSLGGAVASLLTLRLLESTGKWCHDQVQCYTFGCPFFADYRLARYVNKHHKRHMIHIVSRNDIVPKVVPVAFTIYTLWAGLGVGPFRELMHLTRVGVLFAQLLKLKPEKLPFVVAGTQAMTWLPSLLRFLLHRTLALALSHQSGYGYAFAGHLVFLNTETNFLEYADMERWKMENHLSFHMKMGSKEGVKEHSLLSYVHHVFGIESIEQAKQVNRIQGIDVFAAVREQEEGGDGPSNPKVCTTTLKLLLQKREAKDLLGNSKSFISRSFSMKPKLDPKQSSKALKSRVACLIFARRMDEAHPKRFQKQKRQRGLLKQLGRGFHSITSFVHHFDGLFLASSVICIGAHIKRYIF